MAATVTLSRAVGGLGGRPGTWTVRPGACARGLLQARAYSKKQEAIPGVSPEYQEDVSRIIEQAERAAQNWGVAATDFMPPPVCGQAMKALEHYADVGGFSWGGYPQVVLSACLPQLSLGYCQLHAAAALPSNRTGRGVVPSGLWGSLPA
mmetsp:Transcript_33094/g.93664  ORF Transcript_33094/g.93664 Transcript_33094/m.93664 type:complete len:150 (-) Transcript_33094:1051-1500(-)